jgi:hypothetical protein
MFHEKYPGEFRELLLMALFGLAADAWILFAGLRSLGG